MLYYARTVQYVYEMADFLADMGMGLGVEEGMFLCHFDHECILCYWSLFVALTFCFGVAPSLQILSKLSCQYFLYEQNHCVMCFLL